MLLLLSLLHCCFLLLLSATTDVLNLWYMLLMNECMMKTTECHTDIMLSYSDILVAFWLSCRILTFLSCSVMPMISNFLFIFYYNVVLRLLCRNMSYYDTNVVLRPRGHETPRYLCFMPQSNSWGEHHNTTSMTYYDILQHITTYYDILRHFWGRQNVTWCRNLCHKKWRNSTTYYDILRHINEI